MAQSTEIMAWPTEKKLAFIQALLISDVAELMEENGRLRQLAQVLQGRLDQYQYEKPTKEEQAEAPASP
jgi:regulator of replication initiation timing